MKKGIEYYKKWRMNLHGKLYKLNCPNSEFA